LNFANFFVIFLTSILIFSSVNREHYGLYVILLSLFAFAELLMAGLDDSIVRFIKSRKNPDECYSIIKFAIIYRLCIVLLFACFFLVVNKLNLLSFLISDFDNISTEITAFFSLIILNGLISSILSTASAVLNGFQFYERVILFRFIKNLSYIFFVLILIGITDNYFIYLIVNSFLIFALLIYVIFYIEKSDLNFQIKKIFISSFKKSVIKNYIFTYTAPLTLSSLMSYSKNHLPTLVLGSTYSLEQVAVFSVLKNLFKSLHSLMSAFFNPMISKFNEMKSNVKYLESTINSIFNSTFLIRFSISVILWLYVGHIFDLYNIEVNSQTNLIFKYLILEFILANLIMCFGIYLRLETNTRKIFYASSIRFFVEITLIFLFIEEFGAEMAAIILLIGRLVETIASYFLTKKDHAVNLSGTILVIFICIVAIEFSRLIQSG